MTKLVKLLNDLQTCVVGSTTYRQDVLDWVQELLEEAARLGDQEDCRIPGSYKSIGESVLNIGAKVE